MWCWLDAQSRWHLRVLAGQVMLLMMVGIPALLIDQHRPKLFLLELRGMFGLSALVLLVLGVLARQRWSPVSLCLWDHVLAFALLKLGCSILLWWLG